MPLFVTSTTLFNIALAHAICGGGRYDDLLKAIGGADLPALGFGMGDATAEIAKAHPDNGYIAIEVHPPGIGKLLSLIEEYNLSNVRIIEGDAIEIHWDLPAQVRIYAPFAAF